MSCRPTPTKVSKAERVLLELESELLSTRRAMFSERDWKRRATLNGRCLILAQLVSKATLDVKL